MQEYCLDMDSQIQCDHTHKPLLDGKTIFFGVQPKFMNVNIRLVIDVLEGATNVYFSSVEDAFVVEVLIIHIN